MTKQTPATDITRPDQAAEAPFKVPDVSLRPGFWSTVEWPLREGLTVIAAVAIFFFGAGCLYAGPLYGLASAVPTLPAFTLLWGFYRVLKAWAEWPSQRRWLSWLKAAVRYLLTDP